MTRRRKPLTVPEADVLMESLGWIRGQGWPNKEVRQPWECAVTYWAAVHRQEAGGERGEKSWAEEVKR